MGIALELLKLLLSQVDRELFVDIMDAVIDKVEARFHDSDSIKGKALMALCSSARVALDVPDDDVDQGNPV